MLNFGVTEQKSKALERRMLACGLKEDDLTETFIKSSGPGGQHANKNSTCVKLMHKPTGLKVKNQDSRSQQLNRYHARKQMCKLLECHQLGELSPEAKRIAKRRKQKQRRKRRSNSTLRQKP